MEVFVVLIAAIALYVIFTYNKLVTFRNRVKEAWSDIETQLKRRYDLIPNLVETVKGYAAHEAGTLQKVTEARTSAMANQDKDKATRSKDENFLSGTLKSLFAVAENYPDLKANQNFLELQRELTDTEDKIQAARRFHNSNVLALNNTIEQFPSKFVAQAFKFGKGDFFELDAEGKEAASRPVKVSFTTVAAEATGAPAPAPTPAPSPAPSPAPTEEAAAIEAEKAAIEAAPDAMAEEPASAEPASAPTEKSEEKQ